MFGKWSFVAKRGFSSPPVVKILSLDARDTLIKLKDQPGVVYSRFCEEKGIKIDPKDISSTFLTSYKKLSVSHPCFGHNSIGSTSWWHEVVKNAIRSCSPETSSTILSEIADDVYQFYSTPEPWELVESDIKTTLQKFRLKGIHLVVVSNFDSRLKLLLKQFELYNLFSMIILSGEVGFEKPDRRIFDLIPKHFELSSPSEILHIGDHVKNDFLGAKNYGCRSILFGSSSSVDIPAHDRILKLSSLNLY